MDKIEIIKTGKTKKYKYQDQVFDSKEEIYFSFFCDDLIKNGYAVSVQKNCPTYTLIEEAEYYWIKKARHGEYNVISNLLQSVKYTPDFIITWHDKALEKFVYILNKEDVSALSKKRNPFIAVIDKHYPNDKLKTYIDVKGSFGQHGDAVKFPLLQKMMFSTHGIYVQKVVPKQLFEKTFVPERYKYTDGGTRGRVL